MIYVVKIEPFILTLKVYYYLNRYKITLSIHYQYLLIIYYLKIIYFLQTFLEDIIIQCRIINIH